MIPEELRPPREIRAARRYMRCAGAPRSFIDAAFDPHVNALACAMTSGRRRLPATVRHERAALARDAVTRGPDALTSEQRTRLLGDPWALSWVHSHLWLTGAEGIRAASAEDDGGETDSGATGYAAAA